MRGFDMGLVGILVVLGATNTILLSLQSKQKFTDGANQTFFHPFIQTTIMFFAELLSVVPYLLFSKQTVSAKPKAPIGVVAIPAAMDLIATLLAYFALGMVNGSVWQISRGGTLLTTAIFSRLILKKRFSKAAGWGCIIAFLGVTFVQLVTVLSKSTSSPGEASWELIGVMLLLASLVFNGLALVSEKMIFNKFEISPLKMVALEGLYGAIIMAGVVAACSYIQCPWESKDPSKCNFSNGQYTIESVSVFLNQINQSPLLLGLTLGTIVSIGVSVPVAVTISKRISPVSRALADVCRTVIIWAFGISMTLTIGKGDEAYELEDTSLLVNLGKIVGFSILILGTLLHHELLPCLRSRKSMLEADGGYKSLLTTSRTPSIEPLS